MAITEIATVAEVPEGRPGNSIFVSVNDLGNGKLAVDLRRWYQDDAEEWKPTSKGISIPTQYLNDVIDGLIEARDREDVQEAIAAPAAKRTPGVKKVVTPTKKATKRTRR
jgi:hypothetical protein